MEINTVIEVQSYVDFGVKSTDCVMVHYEKFDKDELLKEFYFKEGINSNKGLDFRILSKITFNFIVFLESKGFKKLKTQEIYFCD